MDVVSLILGIISVLALVVIGIDSGCDIYFGLKNEKERKKPEPKPVQVKRPVVGFNTECIVTNKKKKKVEVVEDKNGRLDMIIRV